MSFFSIGGRVKNKRFDYIPQHYDPSVEDLKARMVKYGSPDISDAELAKARIKTGFRIKARGNKEALKEGNKKSNIRLLLVAVGLIISSLYMLQSDVFFKFIDGLLT
ncbi:MAG: hypothetical protein ACJATI_004546 [Halioglobus sp.]|jgi:hypothetical protein